MYHSRIKYLILILLSFLFFESVSAIVKPTEKFYINDYANILSEETENYIYEKSVSLYNADGTQIVVVTIPNLENKSLEEYGLELARSFGIGSSEKNNGLLLLLSLEERLFRVEVGEGLEGILPDGKTGRFQDEYIIPYLKEDKFDEGIKNGYNAFFNEIVTLNNLDLDTSELEQKESSLLVGDFIILSGSIGLLAGIYLKLFEKKNKILTISYMIIAIFLIVFGKYIILTLPIYVLINLCVFIFTRFFSGIGGGYYNSSGRGYRSSSGSRGSFHSGGGGSFSGGGSSRHF